MNWFQHDADSTQDAKIKKLLIRHGAIGYAVYFHCLELIIGDVCETNITFELEHDSEIIADNLKIAGTGDKSGRDIVEDIMRTIVDLGLFTNENGHIFCYKLLKRINMSMTSNKGLREAITSAKELNHDEIMTHHDKIMIPTNLPTYQPTKQPTKPEKHKYGSFQNIILTDDEKQRLVEDFHALADMAIQYLSEYKVEKGYVSKSDNLTIRRWVIDAVRKREGLPAIPKQKTPPEAKARKCPKCGGEMRGGGCTVCFSQFDSEGNEI